MRIVTQEELDAAELTSPTSRWKSLFNCDACEDLNYEYLGCSTLCVQAVGDAFRWYWHGVTGERPTPESILTDFDPSAAVQWGRCLAGHKWLENPTASHYAREVHARHAILAAAINGEYDEDAERARLVAVPA